MSAPSFSSFPPTFESFPDLEEGSSSKKGDKDESHVRHGKGKDRGERSRRNGKERKDRGERRSNHDKHSERKDDRHASKHGDISDNRPVKPSKPSAADIMYREDGSILFYYDRKGDSLNITFGGIHAGDIPRYKYAFGERLS